MLHALAIRCAEYSLARVVSHKDTACTIISYFKPVKYVFVAFGFGIKMDVVRDTVESSILFNISCVYGAFEMTPSRIRQ